MSGAQTTNVNTGNGKVRINGHEVQGNSGQLMYFPVDHLVKDVTPERLARYVKTSTARCYVYFMPSSVFVPGARTFAQVDPSTGEFDRCILELFCCLHYRKRDVYQDGMNACALVTERAVGPQGETRGWFFFLIDNVVQTVDADREPKLTQTSVSQYIKRLLTSSDEKKFEHLKPRNSHQLVRGKVSPFEFWPNVQRMRSSEAHFQRMVMFYKDEHKGVIESVGQMMDSTTNPYNPCQVFTLENALRRYNRCYGWAYYDGQSITSISQFLAKFPMDPVSRVRMPSIPTNAIILLPCNVLPQTLSQLMKPEDQYEPDFSSPEYLSFRSQHAHSSASEVEIMERFRRQIGTVLGVQARVTMADFFEMYRNKQRALVPRRQYIRHGYLQWSSVWNPLMTEGDTYAAMNKWGREYLHASTDRNFCMSVQIRNPEIPLIGNILDSFMHAMNVFRGVASAHKVIVLQTLVMHSGSYFPSMSRNLMANFMKAGGYATSKTFTDSISKNMCIPDSVTNVAYATEKSTLSNMTERGYIELHDEINIKQLGADNVVHNKALLFDIARDPPKVSNVLAEGLLKNAATNRDNRVVQTAAIIDGKRVTISTKVTRYGVVVGNTNASEFDLPVATASRWIFYTTRKDDGTAFDGLDMMTGWNSKMEDASSKPFRAMTEWMRRNHYLSTLVHILTDACILPPFEQSLFCRRYNMVAHHLNRLGMPNAREKRYYEKTWQVALQLAHIDAITKVYDMGIGGPDPSREARDSDLEYLVPLMYVDDPIFVMVMELVPALNDLRLLSIIEKVRVIFDAQEKKTSDEHRNYYIHSDFFTGLSDQRNWRKCDYLADEVVAMGCPYDDRTVFGVLAQLTRPCVPVVDTNGRIKFEPGWKPDVAGLVFHRLLVNNLHEDVMFEAINEVVEVKTPYKVLRGVTEPGNPSQLKVGTISGRRAARELAYTEEQATAKARYDAAVAEWTQRFAKDAADLKNMPSGEAKERIAARMARARPKVPEVLRAPDNPKKMMNPNYREKDYIQSLAQGALGAADTDDVTTLLGSEEKIVESKEDDRDKMVEEHLKRHGIDPLNNQHYAFPAVMDKLVRAYHTASQSVRLWYKSLKKVAHDAMAADGADLIQKTRRAIADMCTMWVLYRQHGALPEPVSHPRFIDAWLRKRLIRDQSRLCPVILTIYEGFNRRHEFAHPSFAEIDSLVSDYLSECRGKQLDAMNNAAAEEEKAPSPLAQAMDVDAEPVPPPPAGAMDVDVKDDEPDPVSDDHKGVGFALPSDSEDGSGSSVGGAADESAMECDDEEENDNGKAERELQRRARERRKALSRDKREAEAERQEPRHKLPVKPTFSFAARAKPRIMRRISDDANGDSAMCITPMP